MTDATVVAIASVLGVLITGLFSIVAAQVNRYHRLVNSRLDELIVALKAVSFQEGKEAQKLIHAADLAAGREPFVPPAV